MITIWTAVTIISGCLYYYITDCGNPYIPENEEEDEENEYEEDIQNKELSKSLE